MPFPIDSPRITLLYAGEHACAKGHAVGPLRRDHWIFHFVLSGRGSFHRGLERFDLGAGDGFVIPPGRTIRYVADRKSPWRYAWFALKGPDAETVLREAGVDVDRGLYRSRSPKELGERMVRFARGGTPRAGNDPKAKDPNGFARWSDFFRITSAMRKGAAKEAKGGKPAPARDLVAETIEALQRDLASPLSIEALALSSGLGRSRFNEVFKARTGRSPRDYRLRLRLERAVDLLRSSGLKIGEIAERVGFDDPLHFSRQFRKAFGTSPRPWREKATGGARKPI